jgi:hypothetical protein
MRLRLLTLLFTADEAVVVVIGGGGVVDIVEFSVMLRPQPWPRAVKGSCAEKIS